MEQVWQKGSAQAVASKYQQILLFLNRGGQLYITEDFVSLMDSESFTMG